MQITKFGHSCILLDDGQTKILFDPGSWAEVPDLAVDSIVITHVHQDHFDLKTIQRLLNIYSARVITNTEVNAELGKADIVAELVEQGQTTTVGNFSLDSIDSDHAVMHPSLPKFQNTGYIVNGKIFHPGDSLILPTQPIEILLLPVSAPWSKLSETLDYISAIKPKVCFPIHDGFLKRTGAFYRFAGQWCEKIGAEFVDPELNKPYDFPI